MRAMGIDPGCEWVGYAGADGDLHTIRTRTKNRGERCDRIMRAVMKLIRAHPPLPVVCALESYAYGVGKKSLVRSAEAHGAILQALYLCDVVPVEIPPASLKLFATGNGAADKEAMIERAVELTRALFDEGELVIDEHRADAFHLRRMVAYAYADGAPLADHEAKAIAGVNWPTLDRR